MATYYARKAGNINATDVWATTPTGTASNLFPTFTSADVLMSNSFAITVNVSTTVAEVRNDTTGGATIGGAFSLSAGVTLAADLYNAAGGVTLLTCAITAPSSAAIVSNVIRNASSNGNAFAVNNTGSGTLNISVSNNITGGAGGSGVNRAAGVNAAGGIVNITGNVTGGTHASAPGAQANGGMLNITGIVTGNVGPGAANMLSGTTTIIGPARGGASAVGAINESTGMLVATRAVGNAYGPGNVAGLAATVGISNAGLGVVEIQELEYGTNGMSPTSGTGIRLKKANTNVAVFSYADTAGAKTLIDATQNAAMPAASNVRSGVSYASGALTGSCAVPAAGSVALGVPVDATTGTAVLTPAAVWSHATRTITGGLVDTATTLTNAPTVPTTSQIASQVRTELSSELAKVSALNTTRLGQCTTTEILGNLLAQANS
jgi:fibronectin-binding autotransporter adhesin